MNISRLLFLFGFILSGIACFGQTGTCPSGSYIRISSVNKTIGCGYDYVELELVGGQGEPRTWYRATDQKLGYGQYQKVYEEGVYYIKYDNAPYCGAGNITITNSKPDPPLAKASTGITCTSLIIITTCLR